MAQEILQEISKALETHEPNPLVFTELDRDVASQVLALLKQPKYNFDKSGFRHVFRLHYSAPDRYLRLVLLTDIHESVAGWMRREVSIWFGDRRLDAATLDKIIGWTPTYENFSGEYATSKKTPDLAWTPCIDNMPNDYPSVVLESGYSESDAQLMRDSLVWLQGTDGVVKVVVLCKTFPPDKGNKIKATLSIFRRMDNGEITQSQWPIFPVPDDNRADPYITIDEFFSGSAPAGHDPKAQLPLSLQPLRAVLKGTIQKSGHLTA